MPRIPRKLVFDPTIVGIYHCISRCVRRAFLCGTDKDGSPFDHRKDWIQKRLQFLAAQFGMDVLGFAIMSNHIHLILRNRPDVVRGWSDREVARRWRMLFPLGRDACEEPREPAESELLMIMADPARLAELRARLSSISWFMRCLAEPIARWANKEDRCSGHFWEGRFRSQPVLDESALVACLAYVDLNPIRAHVAKTPETSQFTSVFERIEAPVQDSARPRAQEGTPPNGEPCVRESAADKPPAVHEDQAYAKKSTASQQVGSAWLSPFELSEDDPVGPVPSARASNRGCVPMRFAEYRALLDWTACELRKSNLAAASPCEPAPIPTRINVMSESWLQLMRHFSGLFRRAAGTPTSLREHTAKWQRRRTPGMCQSRAIFV